MFFHALVCFCSHSLAPACAFLILLLLLFNSFVKTPQLCSNAVKMKALPVADCSAILGERVGVFSCGLLLYYLDK